MASTASTDWYSEVVIIVHTCAFSLLSLAVIDVAQTILVILTMAGLFPDKTKYVRNSWKKLILQNKAKGKNN